MTREEQIAKAVCGLRLAETQLPQLKLEMAIRGFAEGATWADANPYWHKYPDEKPRYTGYYLVAYNNGIVTSIYYMAHLNKFNSLYVGRIIAWMEYPAPPKFD